jgi:hypothetical protein
MTSTKKTEDFFLFLVFFKKVFGSCLCLCLRFQFCGL